MVRGSDVNTLDRMRAILTSPGLLRLGARFPGAQRTGRPPLQPPYVLLAYGALARLARSGIRVERDLAEPTTWNFARTLLTSTIEALDLDVPPPGPVPPCWDHWRWFRDHQLSTDEGLGRLGREFPAIAADLAHEIGLCRPNGGGSFTHPAPERCIYGDGTLVRPLYAPPVAETITLDDGTPQIVYPDPKTGQLHEHPTHRFDPDLQLHHGQLGPVLTHGYVAWHARGPAPYQRVILGVAHIPRPGQEMATSVRLAADVHRHLGDGVQAAIYDGAMHGVHIEQVMRRYGWLAIAKTPAGSSGEDPLPPTALFVNRGGRMARSFPLGTLTHATMTGPCHHQLAAIDATLVELGMDENGDPVVIDQPTRGPVKRSRRSNGEYYFNVAYRIACPTQPFTTWLSPHPGKGDDGYSRPHNLRIITADDPDNFARLHGLRNDAENYHSNLKRTLLVGRSMSLGWRRGLSDIYCFALLSNALTEQRAARETVSARHPLRTRERLHRA